MDKPKFIEEYKKIIKVENVIKDIDDPYIKEKIKKLRWDISSVNRLSIYNKMFLNILPKKTEYTTTVFKIIRPDLNKETIFGYLYSYIEINQLKKSNQKSKLDLITHEYVCHGQTYKSCDGEFRHRFFSYDQFVYIKNHYKKIYDDIKNFITNEKQIVIQSNSYYPQEVLNNKSYEFINKQFNKNLEYFEIAIYLFMSAWVVGYRDVLYNRKANHVEEKHYIGMYGKDGEKSKNMALDNVKSKQKTFFEYLLKKYDSNQIKTLIEQLTYLLKYPYTLDYNVVECGQKLMPLKIKEIENYGNIKYSPWKEKYINSIVNALVINGISPCVPIYVDWFLINTTDKGLFENEASYTKIDHSEKVKEIIKNLENARRDTYIYNNEEIYLSHKMEGLSSAIEYPMDYAEAEIALSNYTLCTIGEYLGRTFADHPQLLINPKYKYTTNFFETTEYFAKYIFEYVYTLLCLNSKLDIIHGDLHLNNITIFINKSYDKDMVIDPYVLFYMDEHSYIFKTFGFYSCVIDFSRSIIGENRIKKDFADREDEYLIIQRRRLMGLMEQLLPEMAEKYKLDIEILLYEKYQLMFKIFTALDTYKVTRAMIEFLKDKTIKENLELLQKMNKIAFNFVRNKILQAIQKDINYPADIPYPNKIIIDECFEEYRLDHFIVKANSGYLETLNLIDVFNYTNEIEYETKFHENIPKILQIDYLIKNKLINASEYRKVLSKYSQYLKYISKLNLDKIAEEEEERKMERRGIEYD